MVVRRQRRAPAVPEEQRVAIEAGLRGEDCPPAGRWWHYVARYHATRSARLDWPKIELVFRSLPLSERQAIISRRREERHAMDVVEMRRAHLAWIREHASR